MMEDVKCSVPTECYDKNSLIEFLNIDAQRIKERCNEVVDFLNPRDKELILRTKTIWTSVSTENFKRAYKDMNDQIFEDIKDFRSKGFNVKCTKVELVYNDGPGVIYSNSFHFKITLEKQPI